MKTIAQIKTTISPRLHGTTLNKLGDFFLIAKDASEIMVNRINLQEMRRKALIPNAVYDNVYDYSVPADFKDPIDINTQADTNKSNDSLSRTYSRQFNNQKKNNQFAIVWKDGTQFLRYAKYTKSPVVLDKADSVTENGTWIVSGNGSNLEVDTFNYISGTGSLKCDISDPGAIVSVKMDIGTDSSNYYSKTVTTGHFEAFMTGWNLLRFDLSDSIETGSVNMASIAFLQFTVTYNTNQTVIYSKNLSTPIDLSVDNYKSDGAIFAYLNFATKDLLSTLRLDNITANIGTLYNLDYYSNYLFRTSAGAWIETPTSDNDIVNLSSLSYQIYEAEICKVITQRNQGSMGGFDFAYWNSLLEGDGNKEGLYDQYATRYPSEITDGQSDYYNFSDDFDNTNDEDEEDWGNRHNN